MLPDGLTNVAAYSVALAGAAPITATPVSMVTVAATRAARTAVFFIEVPLAWRDNGIRTLWPSPRFPAMRPKSRAHRYWICDSVPMSDETQDADRPDPKELMKEALDRKQAQHHRTAEAVNNSKR